MSETNNKARETALQAWNAYQPRPTSIVKYQSSGLVAVVAGIDAWKGLDELTAPLRKLGVITASASAVSGQRDAVATAGRAIEMSGHLGAFELRLKGEGGSETLRADIVLDMGDEPLCTRELPPPGYLYANPSETTPEAVVEQLLDMTGEFEKPRFFNYQPDICAHGVNGAVVCTRCIDACPADAISSTGAVIEVDPNLCQGGGVCATVCPSGAIQYALPSRSDSGNRLRKMLQAYLEAAGERPVVLFHAASCELDEALRSMANLLPNPVEEIASVGMDLCLSALVYGADQVLLLVDEEAPKGSIWHLQREIKWAHDLLQGLGIDKSRLQLVRQGQHIDWLDTPIRITPAVYSMPDNKRQAIFQAVDHLYQQLDDVQESVDLPVGAPFGSASINADSCTLCMACVGACPGRALQDGSNRQAPEVFFIESNCLQCGACTLTCPENAISITPRLVLDRETRNQARMLNQDTPFACISCGKPFAPSSVIHKMTFRLQGHHMFQSGRALDRLKMCENCRVADIVQDDEAMNGQFDPLESLARNRLP